MGNLRYYESDFVVVTKDGRRYLAETKGLEDVNGANKDRAAHLWCENATKLTNTPWAYVKIFADGLQTAPADCFRGLAGSQAEYAPVR